MIELAPLTAVAERRHQSVTVVRRAVRRAHLPAVRLGRALRVSPVPLPTEVGELRALLDQAHYTIDELACWWDLHPDTIQRAARRGELPMARRGRVWTISRTRLASWLAGQLWRTP